MSKRLTGLNTLAYMGVEPLMPPEMYNNKIPPTPNDFRGFNIGDFWTVLDDADPQPLQLWVLLSLEGNVATWVQLFPGGGGVGTVTGLRSDDGGIALPFAGIINVLGDTVNIHTMTTPSTIRVILNNSIILPATTADTLNGVIFIGGVPAIQMFGTRNVFLGGAGNFTLTGPDNVGIGSAALSGLTTGSGNTVVGTQAAGFDLTTGSDNSFYGANSGGTATTASFNSAFGVHSLDNLLTGSFNIAIGYNAASNYIGAESDNIIIGNNGIVGESNVIRIGTQGAGAGQQNAAYMAGIYETAFASPSDVVQVDSTGKLGSSRGIDGQLLIGAAGASPAWANLTSSGATIAISNGANSINLEAVGGGAPTVAVAFLAQFTPNQTNQTGDGTTVTIGATQALTKIYDVGTNVTTAGVFTAPITAKYYLELTIELSNLTTGAANCQTATVQIVTTSKTYTWEFSPSGAYLAASNATGAFSFQQVCAMSVGDTAHFTVSANASAGGGAKDIGISANTYITGFLVSGAGMGTVALQANDASLAPEVAGHIQVFGDGVNVTTTADGVNTLTIALTGFTDEGLVVGTAGGKLNSLPAATNGQLPIGSTGVDPVVATLTAGTGISIVNGAGSITINGVGGALTWSEVAVNTAMLVNNGYFTNGGGSLNMTLPAVSNIGDTISVSNVAAGWKIVQNAGNQINYGNVTTTGGATGYLQSTDIGDTVTIVCVVANGLWQVVSSIGNITVF